MDSLLWKNASIQAVVILYLNKGLACNILSWYVSELADTTM